MPARGTPERTTESAGQGRAPKAFAFAALALVAHICLAPWTYASLVWLVLEAYCLQNLVIAGGLGWLWWPALPILGMGCLLRFAEPESWLYLPLLWRMVPSFLSVRDLARILGVAWGLLILLAAVRYRRRGLGDTALRLVALGFMLDGGASPFWMFTGRYSSPLIDWAWLLVALGLAAFSYELIADAFRRAAPRPEPRPDWV